MRDIEFRAITPVGIFHTPCGDFSIALHDTGHRVQMWSSDGLVDEFPVTSIEQYTGLKDKNGVKIFEGDVVKAVLSNQQPPFRSEDFIGQVFWSDFEWAVETTDDHWPVASWKCVDIVEVIGNIHENPELIGESK
jgi:uncharacterized phage protein (TIGR01671 family)